MKRLTTNELRELYQRFFETKGHVRISSAPLVPDDDPSVLFTTAGMHPLVPYLKGLSHPDGKRLTDVQKVLRTSDIDEVGDAAHATVFEMLGNWSLGDYFKKEAIAYSWEFLTNSDWLGIDPNYLAVSVFAGDKDAPRDDESAGIWRSQGVPGERITFLGKKHNWWPTGAGARGPQGPDTEMFFWTGSSSPPTVFNPGDTQWVEIWNNVFIQYSRTDTNSLETLPQQNVDTGMGLERVIMILGHHDSIYNIDSYASLVDFLRASVKISDERHLRIVADHVKAATFILADEHPVAPGKSGQGYVLRRLIRRAVRSARVLGVADVASVLAKGTDLVIAEYAIAYPSLTNHHKQARQGMIEEVNKFEQVITKGLKHFDILRAALKDQETFSGQDAFWLYETYGFPQELIEELARELGLRVDSAGFAAAAQEHQKKSRLAAQGLFKGGLADTSEKSLKYHTATHLLHQALQDVLSDQAVQKGSNITPERLRFDFSHPDKLTDEQLQKISAIVNDKIRADLPVRREEMTVIEARKKGALGLFSAKYGNRVSVYIIGDYSLEICGGPHVTRTGVLGTFSIVKEESAGAGVRRIKAVLQ